MRYPKWFARRRVRVWDRRLALYRRGWQQAVEAMAKPGATVPEATARRAALDAVRSDQFYERLVTRALAKRTLWRKRAGLRKAAR